MSQVGQDFDVAGPESSRNGLFGPRSTIGPSAAAKAVAEDASALVRAEIELAKAEITGAVKEKAAGVGMLAAAGVAAWLGLQGLLVTLGFVLALVLPGWAAAAIVTGLLLVVAAVLGFAGRRKVSAPVSLETTKANVEEDVAWAKAHLSQR